MACGGCRQTRAELKYAVRRGDLASAAKTVKKGVGQMLDHLKRPPPATAQFSRKR